MTDTIVSAAPAVSTAPVPGQIQGERHVSEVAGRDPFLSKKAGIGAILAGAAIVCGIILLTEKKAALKPQPHPEVASRQVVRYEPPPLPVAAPVPPVPPQAAPPLPVQPALGSSFTAIKPPPPPSRLLVYTTAGAGSLPVAGGGSGTMPLHASPSSNLDSAPGALPDLAGDNAAKSNPGDLQSRLTPTRLTGVSANVLRNQPFLLTMGALVPCVLQTAIDSTLPGFVTCVIPQDIQGKTGITLMDRGTRVVGEFRGGVQQGIERLFVIWTRAETPQGVVINLDSPATDPLGRSGMDGQVDRHFWQRFGGALLLTTVDGAIQAGVAAASRDGTTTINTGQAQGVVAEALRGSINIAPTVRKNQGELVSIFVARDLDFSTVYRIHPVPVSDVPISPHPPP